MKNIYLDGREVGNYAHTVVWLVSYCKDFHMNEAGSKGRILDFQQLHKSTCTSQGTGRDDIHVCLYKYRLKSFISSQSLDRTIDQSRYIFGTNYAHVRTLR